VQPFGAHERKVEHAHQHMAHVRCALAHVVERDQGADAFLILKLRQAGAVNLGRGLGFREAGELRRRRARFWVIPKHDALARFAEGAIGRDHVDHAPPGALDRRYPARVNPLADQLPPDAAMPRVLRLRHFQRRHRDIIAGLSRVPSHVSQKRPLCPLCLPTWPPAQLKNASAKISRVRLGAGRDPLLFERPGEAVAPARGGNRLAAWQGSPFAPGRALRLFRVPAAGHAARMITASPHSPTAFARCAGSGRCSHPGEHMRRLPPARSAGTRRVDIGQNRYSWSSQINRSAPQVLLQGFALCTQPRPCACSGFLPLAIPRGARAARRQLDPLDQASRYRPESRHAVKSGQPFSPTVFVARLRLFAPGRALRLFRVPAAGHAPKEQPPRRPAQPGGPGESIHD